MGIKRKNKILSLLLGGAVGDALGVPFEFMARGFFKCDDMVGYGTHHQPAGTWSDDTTMTLCLAETIAEGFDLKRLADKFVKWVKEGYMTPYGDVFDIGNATSNAILNYKMGVEPVKCGGTGIRDNGNGSLMRIAPLVFYSTKYEDIRNVSAVTHAHQISISACYAYIKFLEQILKGKNKFNAYNTIVQHTISDFWQKTLPKNLPELPMSKIASSGYVVDTLRASLWCFLTTDNYKDAVLKAVNLGDDTDTTACVTGAIAGLYYGLEEIPEEWLEKLARRELFEEIAKKMDKKLK